MKDELKPFWRNFFDFNWKFGLFLILVICIPRFILVLKINENSASYSSIVLMMLISALAPFIFLTRFGRAKIGFTKPKKYYWLLLAFIIGLVYSELLYFLGKLLYRNTFENWYVYIAKTYNIPIGMKPNDKQILFVVAAVTGMTFSPIGEELFFRGIVHSSFAKSVGEGKASIIDSLAFALTHISHFGFVFVNNGWRFLTIPTIIWVLSMFIASILFFQCRKNSGSILGAVMSHAAFNLGMTYSIFYFLE
ncbi:MAG: type II CAAX endopeptidase family protein [Chitinophagaceae bacterium]